jgi:fibronectin type 3 domain-containing protein
VKYRYKVRARNEHGYSAYSNSDSGYTGNGGGGDDWCPSELLASDGTSSLWVELNWNAGSGEGGHHYRIWRRADGENEFDDIAAVDDNFYHDTTAEPGVWYIYKVERLGEGESCFSNTDEGFRAGGDDEWCPGELSASDGTWEAGVHLEWNAGAGDGSFQVFRRSNPMENFQFIGSTEANSYLDETAAVGVTYQYTVFKVLENETCPTNIDEGWRGETENEWCPGEFAATDGTSIAGVWLTWVKGSGNGVFSVWRRVAESNDAYALVEDGITGNEFLDAGAQAGVHYSYFVRKHLESETCDSNFDIGWRGESGDDWCPGGLSASDGLYEAKIRLEWEPGTGEGTFNVWRKRDGEAFQWILLGNTANHVWNDTADLDAGVTYIYKVVKIAGDDECASNTDSGFLDGGNPMG